MTHVRQIEEKEIGAMAPIAGYMIYRPVCACGWVGLWCKSRDAAAAIGHLHYLANVNVPG